MATVAVTLLRMPALMRLRWVHAFTLSPRRLLGDVVRKGGRAS
jgi:hypothetical protein